MQKLVSMAKLCRINKPTATFTLLWPGLCGLSLPSYPPSVQNIAVFTAGAVLMRGVADTVNDIMDADVDRKVERTKNRPMARGELSDGEAIGFVAAQLVACSLLYCQLNHPARSVATFCLLPLALYPYTKRCTKYPQVVLGLTINLALPMGWCQASNLSILSAPLSVYYLYAGYVFWTLVYDTVYSTMDVNRGDREAKINSIALEMSPERLKVFLHLCTLACSGCFCLSGYVEHFPLAYYSLVISNQAFGHYLVERLVPFCPDSVQSFFLRSCLSMGLVLIAINSAKCKKKNTEKLKE